MDDGRRTHFRTCNLCEAMCGIRIELEGERIAGIRGDDDDPFSRGHVCPKAVALKDLHEDPDRLRRPVRRTASGFSEITWEEALAEAAERLHAVQERHGRDALGVYFGNPNVHNLGALVFGPLLLRALRSRNRFSATSVDQLPHMFASYLMLGHQLLLPIPDIDRTDFMLMLGANPLASNGSLMTAPDVKTRLRAIQERGGRLVVVDPRRTETARIADEHVFIAPGTDALLLWSLLQVVLEEGGARLGHLASVCDGLEQVQALARGFCPEQTAVHTGVPAEVTRRLARGLLEAGSGVVYGRMGCSTQAFGALCQWAINLLNLVTGNFDRPGGAMFTSPAVDALDLPKGLGVGRGSFGRWRSRVRQLPEFGGELPVACMAEEMLTEGPGQIRGMLTLAGNPVLSTPNGARLDEAFAGLETYVAVDLYVNETTRHAHIILPPTSPLERSHYDLIFHMLAVRNTAKFSEACFEPPADAKHDWQILLELKQRLEKLRGVGVAQRLMDEALLRLGPDRMVDLGLRAGPYGGRFGLGKDALSLRRLRGEPHGVDLGPLKACLLERLPKGRIELAPKLLVEDLERLRAAFGEAAVVDGGDARPLRLIGRRHLRSNNSWLHNAERLVKGKDRCTVLMHPDDAAARGVEDGGRVQVRSRVGMVTAAVELTRDIKAGVISLPHGWGHDREGVELRVARAHAGVSLNDLTDELAIDELCGNAALNGLEVTVGPA
ncbi:molybdopterin oxidoreductase family protein [Paraliomyxa miuraensis]|uniref:molybdopterin oxidoreductase family protein n=1 Tax=Paraliomyxa miuraensis TaxID=376150 RepID=UPI00224E906E|nr:molybdopterin oxidoreductase family protein [Paraliomyxa miuraensis]MCX4246375.1 molybdopterin oxidoreductase family protein [Paraliomyxa miuraensis]